MALRLFEGYGVELEYMIVDAETLDVRPIADRILAAKAGKPVADVEDAEIGWSNELVLHVLELKTNGPTASLEASLPHFQRGIREAEALARREGARLLPTAMHPWMDPRVETRLWPHEYGPVYELFDRVFGCTGHGWSNLQSTHLNLPFADDAEFGRLHAAIRAVLPLLPAIWASSPVVEGRVTGQPDNRLSYYRNNARKIPSVTGHVVPEPLYSRREYETGILETIYRDMEPHDPDGIVRHEWVNARGAIARFDRSAIEIRVLDVQECPTADLGLLALVVAVIRALVEERWIEGAALRALDTEELAAALVEIADRGLDSKLTSGPWLAAFGKTGPLSVGKLWRSLLDEVATPDAEDPLRPGGPLRGAVDHVLRHGSLASRIVRGLGRPGSEPDRDALRAVYRELGRCLIEDRLFV